MNIYMNIYFKSILFFWTYNSKDLEEKKFPQQYEAAQVFPTLPVNQKCFMSSKPWSPRTCLCVSSLSWCSGRRFTGRICWFLPHHQRPQSSLPTQTSDTPLPALHLLFLYTHRWWSLWRSGGNSTDINERTERHIRWKNNWSLYRQQSLWVCLYIWNIDLSWNYYVRG